MGGQYCEVASGCSGQEGPYGKRCQNGGSPYFDANGICRCDCHPSTNRGEYCEIVCITVERVENN